jgi:hypothetical protein
MKRSRLVFCALLLLSLGVAACADPGGTVQLPSGAPVPTLAARTQPNPTRPALLIQYCDDDTGSFPRGDFQGANKLMADSLGDAIKANQDGITLYATAITHNTFDSSNTLSPAFNIPAITAYGTPPTPVPTIVAQNPVTDPPTETAVANQTGKGISDYNGTVAVIDQKIDAAKKAAAADTQRLTSWDPPLDTVATSILGCFQLAASRFQNQPGTKMIYIASDLENNTDVDYTQNFVTQKGLAGAIVHVIFFVSPSAARDQQKRAQWCPLLEAAGAKAVVFSDPNASSTLKDVFDTDLAVPAQSCA